MICERCGELVNGHFSLRELRQLPNPTSHQRELIALLEANLPESEREQ
jgi:hypothetical protein